MFVKVGVLLLIVLWIVVRRAQLLSEGKKAGFIIVAGYVLTIPFNITSNIFDFVNYSSGNYRNQFLGAFGSAISIETATVFLILTALLGYRRFDRKIINGTNFWIIVLILLTIISLINTNNPSRFAILVPFFIFLQFFLLLRIFVSNFSKVEILKGIFLGLLLSAIVQFVLTIGYPILGLEVVTNLFRGDDVLAYANRREGYASAIGTFSHPGHMGLFSSLSALFFFSCYLMKYKQRLAVVGLFLSLFALFFTYSRASFAVALVGICFIYSIFISDGKLFTLKNFFLIVVFSSLGLIILYQTPLGELFLASDTDEQFDNRFNHVIIGFMVFQEAPIFGVGINSHIHYMANILNVSSISYMPIVDFYVTNPIHNIHIIVLTEVGLIGFSLWLWFFLRNTFVFSRIDKVKYRSGKLISLMFSGFLLVFFLYGFTGWAPFSKEVMLLMLFVGSLVFMEKKVSLKKSYK